jgi:hypothetical protein
MASQVADGAIMPRLRGLVKGGLTGGKTKQESEGVQGVQMVQQTKR